MPEGNTFEVEEQEQKPRIHYAKDTGQGKKGQILAYAAAAARSKIVAASPAFVTPKIITGAFVLGSTPP